MAQHTKNLICKSIAIFLCLTSGGIVFAHYYPTYIKPCSRPLEYSIGSFDPGFKMSQADFLQAVAEAEQVWEQPTGQDLFQYSEVGPLKINLVYDYRQQASDRLSSLGYKIETTQSSYNNLKSHYDALVAGYTQKKSSLDSKIAQFESRKSAYEKQVQYWNQQGGAPAVTAKSLNAEHDALTAMAEAIQTQQTALNTSVADINGLVQILNNLGSQLKLNVSNYNTIGQSRGEEFEEGLYSQDASGKSINIYEFGDHSELVRVLAHELGHALGLEHVDDPNAIMYRLNQSKNAVLASSDAAELARACGI